MEEGGGVFFLQPATATRATSKTGTINRKRRINAWLLLQFQVTQSFYAFNQAPKALRARDTFGQPMDRLILNCAVLNVDSASSLKVKRIIDMPDVLLPGPEMRRNLALINIIVQELLRNNGCKLRWDHTAQWPLTSNSSWA